MTYVKKKTQKTFSKNETRNFERVSQTIEGLIDLAHTGEDSPHNYENPRNSYEGVEERLSTLRTAIVELEFDRESFKDLYHKSEEELQELKEENEDDE